MGLQGAKKNTKQGFSNSVILHAVTAAFIPKTALHTHTFQLTLLLTQAKAQRQKLEDQTNRHVYVRSFIHSFLVLPSSTCSQQVSRLFSFT
jgi:hypothetical protein